MLSPVCLCSTTLSGSSRHAAVSWGAQIALNWENHIYRPGTKSYKGKEIFSSPSCDLLSLSLKIKYRENISVEIDWPWWQGLIWKLAAVSVGEQINWSDKTFDQNQLRFPADRPPPISIFLNYVRSLYWRCDSRVGRAFCGKTIFQKWIKLLSSSCHIEAVLRLYWCWSKRLEIWLEDKWVKGTAFNYLLLMINNPYQDKSKCKNCNKVIDPPAVCGKAFCILVAMKPPH